MAWSSDLGVVAVLSPQHGRWMVLRIQGVHQSGPKTARLKLRLWSETLRQYMLPLHRVVPKGGQH